MNPSPLLSFLPALGLLAVLSAPAGAQSGSRSGGTADTMWLTDEPGNWFRSDATGTPFTTVRAGERVDFKIHDCCTNTRHTVTILIKPVGSQVDIDQDASQKGSLSAEFDLPGVYVLICKIHPYMTAVVGVLDAAGQVPDVPAASLPFIGHLGVPALPAGDVLAVLRTLAAGDADKLAKWQILAGGDQFLPPIPGVGEVWVNSQFEFVPGQADQGGTLKPGTITVVDPATWTVEREIDGLAADGLWNNPHNMWADFALRTVYNSNWFGKWVNKIDRASGRILGSVEVGEAPTHIITNAVPASPQLGWLSVPLSAEDGIAKLRDGAGGLQKMDEDPTGAGRNHPHGHWLTCGLSDRTVVPNVFQGLGVAGSVSVVDTESGRVMREFDYDPADPLASALLMPLAAGECHVGERSTAYVASVVSGMVTVIDVDRLELLQNIPVTLAPDGQSGLDLFHTLQVPIQCPVSPDERWCAVAVLSLTTVPRANTGAADHVALIDTRSNAVVKYIPTPAGTHGIHWGAKRGGGYYAYVTHQFSNVLSVIDPDPNGDGAGDDAAEVGRILLANGSAGAGVTDGTGGQGVKPLPMMHDGWIQRTVALSGSGQLSAEVEAWVALLTAAQRDPGHHEALALQVDPLFRGEDATATVTEAVPGETVWYLSSLAGRGAGPCPASLGGLCLDVLEPVRLQGSAVANGAGVAAFTARVPVSAPARPTFVQAVARRGAGGAVSVKSNAVTAPLL